MLNISGLETLLYIVRDTGVIPDKLHVLSGVGKPRHGMWIVTHEGLVEQEGYGITSLVAYNVKEAEMFTDKTVCKYIGLTEGQQECCVFGVEAGEEEMIKMKTSLNTKGKKRVVCDNQSGKPDIIQEPLVVINTEPVNESVSEGTTETTGKEETGEDIGETGEDTQIITPSDEVLPEDLVAEGALNPDIKPNFEYAQSLSLTGNKNEQKLALESYARKFGIELNRNIKFDAMMIDFKEKASV